MFRCAGAIGVDVVSFLIDIGFKIFSSAVPLSWK